MKKVFTFLVAVTAVLFLCGAPQAADFDFDGTFTYDNDVVLLNFSVGADSTITIFSSSWGDDIANGGYVAGAGFDPILAIWDDAGNIVDEQDDGGMVGTALSNSVPYTYGEWDSFFDVFLAAGDYTASITQYSNFRNGGNLSNGFSYDGNPDFTFDNGYGPQPYFNGVWDSDDARTGDWAFHILNIEDAQQQPTVPEPATMLLLGSGLLGLIGLKRKFRKS